MQTKCFVIHIDKRITADNESLPPDNKARHKFDQACIKGRGKKITFAANLRLTALLLNGVID